jgi:hypothetical protein
MIVAYCCGTRLTSACAPTTMQSVLQKAMKRTSLGVFTVVLSRGQTD